MPVIDIMPLNMGSASGGNAEEESASGGSAEEDFMDTAVASSALTTDFGGIQETLGQLYVYRYSSTYVVLGTRSAITEDGAVQTALGISEVADGTYHCIAENAITTSISSVVIQAARGGYDALAHTHVLLYSVLLCSHTYVMCISLHVFHYSGGPSSAPTYIRFSTIPVEDIRTRLEFPSEEFVFAMFNTMVC